MAIAFVAAGKPGSRCAVRGGKPAAALKVFLVRQILELPGIKLRNMAADAEGAQPEKSLEGAGSIWHIMCDQRPARGTLSEM